MTELKIPEVGESVQEALLAQWMKREGESVHKDDILFVIETDKVTLEISAPADGALKILVAEGTTVKIGTVVGQIEEAAGKAPRASEKAEDKPVREAAPAKPSGERAPSDQTRAEAVSRPKVQEGGSAEEPAVGAKPVISPAVRALAEEKGVDLSGVAPTGPGGRITQGDVLLYLEGGGAQKPGAVPEAPRTRAAEQPGHAPAAAPVWEYPGAASGEETVRKPMTPIRQRIAARLLEARQNTAMLTTFNEIDMSRIQALRKSLGESFHKKYGVRLGLMSFFVKATVAALKEMAVVNAFIEGQEIVYHNYYHIGMAIGAERGLVVPVIRNSDRLGFAAIERAISDFAEKVKENKLDISDLAGGTFTITNGGVFGSLLSTPILNPPQSAILGLHKIEERPIAVAGQVVIRPMMYVALSYDHRIVDGREAVTFLRRIKEFVENPERILMEI
ncbi:MAG: 2-oxoglutarate dehydrogenase complex dihydrolipoyllysine-residue succinyltransferase [Syntrophobacteraceae bacterium]|nr:2-oxoglutarate dehydrogenase complex dihydrolipoyllysine-residue succinyltransferase [Syntrophobacteraceae bacterium]